MLRRLGSVIPTQAAHLSYTPDCRSHQRIAFACPAGLVRLVASPRDTDARPSAPRRGTGAHRGLVSVVITFSEVTCLVGPDGRRARVRVRERDRVRERRPQNRLPCLAESRPGARESGRATVTTTTQEGGPEEPLPHSQTAHAGEGYKTKACAPPHARPTPKLRRVLGPATKRKRNRSSSLTPCALAFTRYC